MLGRTTTRYLSKVFNEKLVASASEKSKLFIQHVDPEEAVVATALLSGAVAGGAVGKKLAINDDSGKLRTAVNVGVGATAGAGLGVAIGVAAAFAVSEAPIATALILVGGLIGSSLPNRRTKSDSKNGVENAVAEEVKPASLHR